MRWLWILLSLCPSAMASKEWCIGNHWMMVSGMGNAVESAFVVKLVHKEYSVSQVIPAQAWLNVAPMC